MCREHHHRGRSHRGHHSTRYARFYAEADTEARRVERATRRAERREKILAKYRSSLGKRVHAAHAANLANGVHESYQELRERIDSEVRPRYERRYGEDFAPESLMGSAGGVFTQDDPRFSDDNDARFVGSVGSEEIFPDLGRERVVVPRPVPARGEEVLYRVHGRLERLKQRREELEYLGRRNLLSFDQEKELRALQDHIPTLEQELWQERIRETGSAAAEAQNLEIVDFALSHGMSYDEAKARLFPLSSR